MLRVRLDDPRRVNVRRLSRVRASAGVAMGVRPSDGDAQAGRLVHHSPTDAMNESAAYTRLRGPFTIDLDYDGTLIRWSGMWCGEDGVFNIRMDDETVERHRERERRFDSEFVPNCDTEGL